MTVGDLQLVEDRGGGADIAGRWTWPVLLILVGVVGLIASKRSTKG